MTIIRKRFRGRKREREKETRVLLKKITLKVYWKITPRQLCAIGELLFNICLTLPVTWELFSFPPVSFIQIDSCVTSKTHGCVSWSKAGGKRSGTILMNMKGGFVGSGQGIMRRLTCIQTTRVSTFPPQRPFSFYSFYTFRYVKSDGTRSNVALHGDIYVKSNSGIQLCQFIFIDSDERRKNRVPDDRASNYDFSSLELLYEAT